MAMVAQQRRALPANADAEAPRRRRRGRWFGGMLRVGLLLLAALVAYLVFTFVQVWLASRQDDAAAADAIIVLGAAQYDGEPSPVLAARLDHAADLYFRGMAPLIVVTGGRQEGDRFTEARASAEYLEDLEVPGGAIERETTSTHSWESLAAATRFLREDGVETVILVSDPYHSYRIEMIADDLGLDASVSPTRTSPTDGLSELRAMLRETAAVAAGRILGHDRLLRLG